jgi:2-amino-4-hydroxy-6-hydroxymethyldihydropteridine diphosphokinase
MHEERIFLALGTNLGERSANLRQAREALKPEIRIIACSSIYQTPPWGYEDQPAFLNQAIEVRTDLEPLPLLEALKAIEAKMGRLKTFRFGPRLIDLDILFYGQRVVETTRLTLPHPRLAERAFVLVPLHEIAPDFVHPVCNETITSLLKEVDTTGVERL